MNQKNKHFLIPIFFGKTENGEEIYYPWMSPGEAFLVNAQTKKSLAFKLRILILSIIFFSVLVEILERLEVVSLQGANFGTIIIAHLLLYFFIMSKFSKRVDFYKVVKTQRPVKPFLYGWAYALFSLPSLWWLCVTGDFGDAITKIYCVLLVAGLVIMIGSFALISITRGYLFEALSRFSSPNSY